MAGGVDLPHCSRWLCGRIAASSRLGSMPQTCPRVGGTRRTARNRIATIGGDLRCRVVGATGFEPVTSSVSVNEGLPLC
jgi:hypothetical protein